MMKFIANLFLLFTLLFIISCNADVDTPIETVKLCNNSSNICSKKYNETVFACTHNAYNYPTEPSNFLLPNQSQSIQQQLNSGVRALMLDLYYANDNENILLYHGTSLAGANNLKNELEVIANFLKDNPTEILTIILESYIEFANFEKAIEQNGLLPFLYYPQATGEWPILQNMIDSNQRLVILSDVKDENAAPWYIYVWDVAFETHYSNNSQADFSCNTNRGDSNNDLFIFNHFITHSVLGTGVFDSSAVINQYNYLLNRFQECQAYHNKLPNFITVDFHDIGNVIEVVNYLNDL